MKLAFVSILLFLLILAGCGQNMALYNDMLENQGIELDENNIVAFQVNYFDNGGELTVALIEDGITTLVGELSYDSDKFILQYKELSDWLCKYNIENKRVACASTTPADPGEVFRFSFDAKQDASSGKYPLNFKITEINGAPADSELDTFISVK